MSDVVCAILAAGGSTRMGRPKLEVSVAGRTLLERALRAAAGRPAFLVVARLPQAARTLCEDRADAVRIVVNDAPQLGMSHSLRLADAALAGRTCALAVLLLDTPFVDAALVELVAAARGNADVAYPVRAEPHADAGDAGHPVIFGPRARALIGALPPGDTLRALRDDPTLVRVRIPFSGDAPFIDVDTPEDLNRLETSN